MFDIKVNSERICIADGDNNHNGWSDCPQAACSGLAQLEEGE